MRLDRLLVYLRFARTRSKACTLIEDGKMRINGHHVKRPSEEAKTGDVLTFAWGKRPHTQVRIIELLEMPTRRGPPAIARSHYRELDRRGENAIAETNKTEF
ncbi:MAG: S4 domain-containing protein [Erythrobacter sp.]